MWETGLPSEPSFPWLPESPDSCPSSAPGDLSGDDELEEWAERRRPRRERVYGLTARDEGASFPEETTCKPATKARKEKGKHGACRVKDLGGQIIMLQRPYYK